MNKKIILFSITFLTTLFLANAQGGIGIKAGLGYNTNGNFSQLLNETRTIIDNKGAGKSSFNIGFYGKLDLGPIYLRPELIYTKTTSEYKLNPTTTEDYKLSKLDIPVLVGFKLIGPLNFFAGPAFQFILNNDFKGLKYESIKNNFTVGINIGASIEFGKLGIDVRYERGLSSNEANWTNAGDTFTLDSRPEQLIFSISYRLSNKKQ